MDSDTKRKFNNEESQDSNKKKKLEICPHKMNCYRRNPHHFKEYDHPHLNEFLHEDANIKIPKSFPQSENVYLEQLEILRQLNGIKIKSNEQQGASKSASNSNINKNGAITTFSDQSMLEKLKNNSPYNFFFTAISESPSTFKERNSITFTDLLCPSLGELINSLQINFMIDIGWLLEQYKKRQLDKKPLTILYGDEFPDMETFMDKFYPNVSYKFIKMKDPFGCHHSKIGIYAYADKSIRVVVSSANLYFEDWNYYNQGLWISPACPPVADSSDGESATGFKKDLLKYLQSYNLDILKNWIDLVKKADFKEVKVFFVYTVPGRYYPGENGSHLQKVGHLLSQHCILPQKQNPSDEGPLSWGINAQASSIGSMGKSPAEWLRGALLRSLASHKNSPLPNNSNATLNLIYPSVDNVLSGYFGPQSGGCLPYSKATNEKQKWLQSYLHQWKADKLSRTRAMPHIKSYCRISPCLSKLAYFLLTSANLSKSAWGGNIQKDKSVYCRSYEAGVVFLPSFFDEEYFEIANTENNKNKIQFPFMYDLPLIPYKSSDYPWCN